MEGIVAQVKSLAEGVDEATHNSILQSLRDLYLSLETRQDTMQRISYAHLEPILVEVGLDLNLFNILVESQTPLTIAQLCDRTGAASDLLGRILRYLASVGAVKETGEDTFTANNTIKHLIQTKYQDITSPVNTPLQKAFNTELPGFLWAQTEPDVFRHFNRFMMAQHADMPHWLDLYPIEQRCQGIAPEQVLFVDVGGGIGHQCIALKERLPTFKNKVILQDLDVVVTQAIKHEGVETMAHDFLQLQPIKGSRFYYMRNIMHDYPEEKAVIILKNLISALGPDSVILIDDMVLPGSGIHFHATQIDITMMTTLASHERTITQWYALMEKAGLKIKQIYTYNTRYDSVLECVPAE
ncbi:uncharacterized protein N7483_004253 [Penicillium malachiteum]|uniref:uncharacterized protein n=1 Tax=Penicillium malachiteum TaxID=1324776 RepID=UPI002549A979|nr:uncharacterized protein N7483_004253 [Penicillium malachiteum]KAJ5729745.1 hypothetical protein N7483_004253 [Penicillium malachiteum]